MRLLIAASVAAAAAVGVLSTQAHALDQVALRDPVRVEVSTRGVDFRNSRAVEKLYQRMQRAAREACDSRISDRVTTAIDQACARQALSISVASLSRPLLTARHEQAGPAFARGWN